MKRTLIAIVAAMFVATGASAASFSIDTDASQYFVGDLITITVTVDVPAESVGPFSSYGLQVGWDDTVANPENEGVISPHGNSNQNPILAGLSGNTQTPCANTGNTCTIISQVNSTFANVAVGPAQIIGTLVLEAQDLGLLGLSITSFSNLGVTDPSTVTQGANFLGAEVIVPEPTTAALLGLGLIGLGMAGRRR